MSLSAASRRSVSSPTDRQGGLFPRGSFLFLLALGACAHPPVEVGSGFGTLVADLSEPGGFFDTDNLISNETSYLHVVGAFAPYGVHGGAYIGVGPDQNFSYIAAIDPSIAYIIDIRRDNMLQHLLFKALFDLSATRSDYLGALLGRAVERIPVVADTGSIEWLVQLVESAPRSEDVVATVEAQVRARLRTYGVSLSNDDVATIERFHRTFVEGGLDLQFVSFGRTPQSYYPTFRELLLERDLSGTFRSYLATPAAFTRVKRLQATDRIIPVVGDLAGRHALRSIGADIASRGLSLSALYTSNVEFYLSGDGSFNRYVANIEMVPRDSNSIIIRSYFGNRFRRRHPLAVSGYYMSQLLERVDTLLSLWGRGLLRSYGDVVIKGAMPLVP